MQTVCTQLSPGALLDAVRAESGLEVSRATLYRWRKALNLDNPPYERVHVVALSRYGNYLRLGLSPVDAKEKTIEFAEKYL